VSEPSSVPSPASRIPMSPALERTRIVAILRAEDASRAEAVADVLVDHGIACLELTLTTHGALDVLGRLAERLPPEVDLGAGTVLSGDDVRRAVDAGARFVVSPTVVAEVLDAGLRHGLACYPGALTPTEIHTAWTLGATAVKIFPAGALGPDYIRALRAPLPDVPLVPTGSIALSAVPDWLAAGAAAVGLGGPLVGDAMSAGGDLGALARRTREAVAGAR
jgi:2-dehydro-3-deoxyphosphogluconate aldolase/(4S)-4-hydroxy-2-oxoglutarate aldolase